MERFEIGEIVIGQNFRNWPELNGVFCEIVGALRQGRAHDDRTGEMLSWAFYVVRWPDASERWVLPENLRKKRPPTTDEAECHQAMLDCIERAKRGQEVEA